jgi:hypothetical protein
MWLVAIPRPGVLLGRCKLMPFVLDNQYRLSATHDVRHPTGARLMF